MSYNFEDMRNMTFSKVYQEGVEELHFVNNENHFVLYHAQDCCEEVTIEDICGDLSDLENTPLRYVNEVTNEAEGLDGTWTFYTLQTLKGSVTVRWFGQSNGYYSESVDFERR
jgi:hypothetical protein